jgi:microcystin-dependent protein
MATAVDDRYGPATDLVDAASTAVATGGSNQGHPNMQPYQALNFCIALQGVFPSRN